MSDYRGLTNDELLAIIDAAKFELEVRHLAGPRTCGCLSKQGPYHVKCRLLDGHEGPHDYGTFQEADEGFMASMRAGAERTQAVAAEAERRIAEASA